MDAHSKRTHLDENRHRQTRDVKKRFDVHEVGSRDKFKQHSLINLDELRVPLLYNFLNLARFQGCCDLGH